jgi:phage FluMu protein gp41
MPVRASACFQTEMEFTLPKGYRDPRVQQNPAYLAVIVLARVITRLGDVQNIDTRVIEGLFASDLDYLQRMYERVNAAEADEDRVESRGFQTVGEA